MPAPKITSAVTSAGRDVASAGPIKPREKTAQKAPVETADPLRTLSAALNWNAPNPPAASDSKGIAGQVVASLVALAELVEDPQPSVVGQSCQSLASPTRSRCQVRRPVATGLGVLRGGRALDPLRPHQSGGLSGVDPPPWLVSWPQPRW